MSAELSGRVDSLENLVTYMTQDLLQKIDVVTSSIQSSSIDQQLDVYENTLNTLSAQVKTLQSLYTNLYITVQQHYNTFNGHTGQPASSGHAGL